MLKSATTVNLQNMQRLRSDPIHKSQYNFQHDEDQKSRISSKYYNQITRLLAPTEYAMNQDDEQEEGEGEQNAAKDNQWWDRM